MARAADDDAEATYQVQFKGEDKQHGVLSKNGVARAVFANGDVYEGEYAHGKRNGRGVYTFKRGGRYEGTYADNKKDGEGTLTAPDGSRYVGQWKNDKRHGTGTYYYANGDRYIGGWRNGQKHGHGTYLYAKVQCQLAADWSNGHAQNGVWTSHDGTKYTGAFLSNTPNGAGVFQFANGNSETGKFEVKQMPVSDDAPDDEEKKTTFQWVKDEAERVLPDAAPPAVADVEPLKRACRAIDKAVLKLDHFEAIYRLEKKFEGVPNFRKVDAAAGAAAAQSYAIYGSGQPSVSGFQLVLTDILSGGGGGANAAGEGEDITKVVWMNMRQEPVLYVNNMSYAPRDLKALNENMEFPGVDQQMLLTLEQRMAEALRKKTFAAGGIHTFYKDTFAENPADRKNLVLTEDVPRNALDQAIRPISAVYSDLHENKSLEVQYVRLPIVDERSPLPGDFDHLVDTLKGPVAEPQTALYFNCQMGKGRTTTGMVCAVLMKRVIDPNNKEPEPADYNEASPDLALGQYKVIMRLVEALSKGAPEPKPDATAAAAAAQAVAAPAAAAAAAAPAAAAAAAPAADAAGAAADGKSAPAPAAAAPADGAAAAAAPAAAADASAAAAGAAAPAVDVKSADGAAAANGAAPAAAGAAAGASSASTAHKENGELVKAEVDDAMDKCKAMQHLRTCIVEARDKALKEEKAGEPERRAFWKRMGQHFLERYFFLIVFNAYLRDAGRPKRPEKKKKLKPQPAAAAVVVSPPSPTDADAKAAEAKGKAKAKAAKKRRGADDDDEEDGAEEDDADADADAEAAAEAEEERKRAAAEAEAERKAQEEAEEAEEAARDDERWEELKANFVPFSAITFSKWLNERPHLLAILGTRQSGALADFNWT